MQGTPPRGPEGRQVLGRGRQRVPKGRGDSGLKVGPHPFAKASPPHPALAALLSLLNLYTHTHTPSTPPAHSRASICSAKFTEHLLCTSPGSETPDGCSLPCVRPGSPAPITVLTQLSPRGWGKKREERRKRKKTGEPGGWSPGAGRGSRS